MKSASEDRIAACENIGAAISVLRRLDSLHLDDDVRDEITHVRRVLSVTQSRIHERIQGEKKR